MSRWLSRELTHHATLDEIEAEIASLKKKPLGSRTVADTERLADLLDARNRITGGWRRQGCW